MLDGNTDTFWHSATAGPEWVKVDFDETKIITKVVVYRRTNCCKDRYRNMCIILSGDEDTELRRKCTTGVNGQPYNFESTNSIEVVFNPTPGVQKVEVTFNGNEAAQIAELFIHGLNIVN